MLHQTDWIKLNNYQEVRFPMVCPYTEKEADTTKKYVVADDSLFIRIIGTLLQFDRFLTFEIPYHSSGIKDYRKKQTKAILKGLLWGAPTAVSFMIIGVTLAVIYRDNQLLENIGIITGGVGFVGSLVLFPTIHYSRTRKKIERITFKNKSKELWVKIGSDKYKEAFIELNESLITSST